MTFERLTAPGKIGERELRNRMIMSLFPTRMAKDGIATDQMVEWYRARARGGASLVVVESVAVDYPRAYKGGRQLRHDEASHRESLQRLSSAIQAEGALCLLHLTYTSKMKWAGSENKVALVNALTTEDIQDLVERFAAAAEAARDAGYDGVEIQASYGDLLQTFLSPYSNKRTDEYGGSLENRGRFLLQVIRACRAIGGSRFLIQVKYAADEYIPGGFELAEAGVFAQQVQAAGADSILVNGGAKQTKALALQPYALPAGVNVPLAAEIKRHVTIPVIAMGKIKNPQLAEAVIAEGKADFVAMTRALLADPDWPVKVGAGAPDAIRGCIGCLECSSSRYDGQRICTVNPWVGREAEQAQALTAVSSPKKVMVVGAGPAGMQCAVIAAIRGHQVVIYDKDRRLGGLWRIAQLTPHKAEIGELVRYLSFELQRLGVQRLLSRKVELSDIEREEPDVLVIATGARSRRPDIEGAELALDARKAIVDETGIGGRVVVIGGGDTGAETTELLLEHGHEVTLVDRGEEIAPDLPFIVREDLLARLVNLGAKIMIKTIVVQVTPGSVITQREGEIEVIECDTAVMATGEEPERSAFEEFKDAVSTVVVIGDADHPGNAVGAIQSATKAALTF